MVLILYLQPQCFELCQCRNSQEQSVNCAERTFKTQNFQVASEWQKLINATVTVKGIDFEYSQARNKRFHLEPVHCINELFAGVVNSFQVHFRDVRMPANDSQRGFELFFFFRKKIHGIQHKIFDGMRYCIDNFWVEAIIGAINMELAQFSATKQRPYNILFGRKNTRNRKILKIRQCVSTIETLR